MRLTKSRHSSIQLVSLFLGLFTTTLVLALIFSQPRQAGANPAAIVYLETANTPAELRLNIAASTLTTEKVTVVSQFSELQGLVSSAKPGAIMINEAALQGVPQLWLREQLNSGVVIIGINSTRRSLSTHLGVSGDGIPPSTGGLVNSPPTAAHRSAAEEAALDWKHPSLPTFVIYYLSRSTFTPPDGKVPVLAQSYGSVNEAYNPAQPRALFFLIGEAVQKNGAR